MSDKYYRKDEWWVSPYNYIPEVTKTYDLPPEGIFSIHDATLRDGEQDSSVRVRTSPTRSPSQRNWTKLALSALKQACPRSLRWTFRPSRKSRA